MLQYVTHDYYIFTYWFQYYRVSTGLPKRYKALKGLNFEIGLTKALLFDKRPSKNGIPSLNGRLPVFDVVFTHNVQLLHNFA